VRKNPAEALEAFRIAPQRFDLLITDQAMPGMSGLLLIRECRRLRPDLPVIVCTGSERHATDEEVRLQGVGECVLKPLTLHDLAHTIRRVLDASVPTPQPNPAPVNRGREMSTPLIEETDAISTRR
jgi:CheY-like chemotaxis protein